MDISKIKQEINSILKGYGASDTFVNDALLLGNLEIKINPNNFKPILFGVSDDDGSEKRECDKEVHYIDGGQAEILLGGSFCLSFIRVAAACFKGAKRINFVKEEFFLLSYSSANLNGMAEEKIVYESKIFPLNLGSSDVVGSKLVGSKLVSSKLVGSKLVGEGVGCARLVNASDLKVSSNDKNLRSGIKRASISKVTNMARRFAELELARRIAEKTNGFVVLDGSLQASFTGEEEKIRSLPSNVVGLAKSNSLFTKQGNNPCVLLSKVAKNLGLDTGCWVYNTQTRIFDSKVAFVKLHKKARHVFRFEFKDEKNCFEILSNLLPLSNDAIFLGYPYGLLFADKIARVSEKEKRSMRIKFLLSDLGEIKEYLATNDAHNILDNLG